MSEALNSAQQVIKLDLTHYDDDLGSKGSVLIKETEGKIVVEAGSGLDDEPFLMVLRDAVTQDDGVGLSSREWLEQALQEADEFEEEVITFDLGREFAVTRDVEGSFHFTQDDQPMNREGVVELINAIPQAENK